MRKLVHVLAKIFPPVLALGYLALCLTLLAITETEESAVRLGIMAINALLMILIFWGVYEVLAVVKTKMRATPKELVVLVYIVEILELVILAATVVAAIVLNKIADVIFFVPVALAGVAGAVRFHDRHGEYLYHFTEKKQ